MTSKEALDLAYVMGDATPGRSGEMLIYSGQLAIAEAIREQTEALHDITRMSLATLRLPKGAITPQDLADHFGTDDD